MKDILLYAIAIIGIAACLYLLPSAIDKELAYNEARFSIGGVR